MSALAQGPGLFIVSQLTFDQISPMRRDDSIVIVFLEFIRASSGNRILEN